MGLPLSIGGKQGSAAQPISSDNAPLERLIALNEDLTNAEVARISKEAIYRLTETQDPDVVLGIGSSTLASGIGAGSPVGPGSEELTLLANLREQEGALKVQLASDITKYGTKNPAIVQLHNQIAALDGQIHDELGRIRLRTKNELDLAKLAEDGIRQRVEAQEQEVNKTSTKADQLLLLQEEALSDRSLYDDLYTKLEEANVAAGIHASNITLVDPARVSPLPSSPKPVRGCAIFTAIGLFFGLAVAFLQNYFDDSIVTPDDLDSISSNSVIGVVPDFAQGRGRGYGYGARAKAQADVQATNAKSWIIQAPRSQVAEAYRTFRTAIMLSQPEHPPKSILITSGSPGEGKSTTAFNTAMAFAVQGARVLLIDADLRRGKTLPGTNLPKGAGLSTYLTSSASSADHIVQSDECDTLFQMQAGPIPPNPAELIGSRRFTELLTEMKAKFDFVFIDSPPVLLVTDAQLISPLTDGYIVVARSNSTTKRQFRRIMNLMREPNPRSLGVLLNAADTSSAAYTEYGYYGGKHDYYGSDNA
jgi:capsular exopolysaccharide synthesis family protein